MERPIVNVVATGTTRDYDAQYSTKVLKANIPFADQVTDENTKYIIRWNFDLGGDEVEIPANCILQFEGGNLSNGTLVGNGTQIVAEKYAIFNGITIDGTWDIPEITSAWFADARSDNGLKNVFALQDGNVKNTIIIEEGDYYVSVSQNRESVISLTSNIKCIINGDIILSPNGFQTNNIFYISDVENVEICGSGNIIGDRYGHDYETSALSIGPKVLSTDAANTPVGYLLHDNGDVIAGELEASASIVGNVYWVRNALDTPDEYLYVQAIESTTNSVTTYGFKIVNTHQWGMGVNIVSSSNVNVSGITIKECTGDGIYIGGTAVVDENDSEIYTTYPSKNVNISNFVITDCRRQGISITCASLVNVSNGNISNIRGTNPMAAIDIEPNPYMYCEGIIINNLNVNNPGTAGIKIQKSSDPSRHIDSIIVQNCNIRAFAPIQSLRTDSLIIQNCNIIGSRYREAMSFKETDILCVENCYIDDSGDDEKVFNYTDNAQDCLIFMYYNVVVIADKKTVLRNNVIVCNYRDRVIYTERYVLIHNNFISAYGLPRSESDVTVHPGDFIGSASQKVCSVVDNNISTKVFTITRNVNWRNNLIETKKLASSSDINNVTFEYNTLSVSQQNSAISITNSIFRNNNISISRNAVGITLHGTEFKDNTIKDVITANSALNAWVLSDESSLINNEMTVDLRGAEIDITRGYGIYSVFRLSPLCTISDNTITIVGKDNSSSLMFSETAGLNSHNVFDNIFKEINKENPDNSVFKNGLYTHIRNRGYIRDISNNIGTSSERPVSSKNRIPRGHVYFDVTLNKQISWNGEKWVSQDGYTATDSVGYIRPELIERGGVLNINEDIGLEFFDKMLGAPVYLMGKKSTFIYRESQAGNSWNCYENTFSEGLTYNVSVKNTADVPQDDVVFGFAKNNNPSDDDILIILNSNEMDINFVGVDPSVYPYIYINNTVSSARRCYFYKVQEWTEVDGATAGVLRSGSTANRPDGGDIYVGFMYMDTTLGKPIYASAISGDTVTWVDANGEDPDTPTT